MIEIKKITTCLVLLLISFSAFAQSVLDGDWAGSAQLFGSNRLIQLRFTEQGNRQQNSFDMPGANAVRLPITNIQTRNSKVSFIINSPRGDFQFESNIQGSIVSGTAVGPFDVNGTMHFMKAFASNENLLKRYVGEYLLSNGQKAFISYNSLNSLDLVTTENNASMALTRDVKLIPQSEVDFFTTRMAIAKSGTISEIVSFDVAADQTVKGFRILASDRPELTAIKTESSYSEEQVVIYNGNIQLGGTLLLPKGKIGLTAVHTMHGAGPKLRSNTLAMLRARLIAESLGVAVLICDKRGVGHVSGSDKQATFTELANDAQAALRYLKNRPEINPSKVGLMGVSHSGWVLPIAIQSGDANFGILVSSTPLSNEVVSTYEIESQMKANRFSEKEIADALAFTKLKWNYALTGTGWSDYEDALKKSVYKKWFDLAEGPPDQEPSRWEYMQLKPLEDRTIEKEIKKMALPMLLLFGSDSLDDRIPVNRSIQKWNELLGESQNTNLTIKTIDGTGHGLFFKAENGKPVKCEEAFEELGKWMAAKGFLND